MSYLANEATRLVIIWTLLGVLLLTALLLPAFPGSALSELLPGA